MARGFPPDDVAELICKNDVNSAQRQLALMNVNGESFAISGAELEALPGVCGIDKRGGCIAVGNLLSDHSVVTAMTKSFEETNGDLADRLIGALAAGQNAGGEVRGMQAAGVLVFEAGGGIQGNGDKLVDISVYDHANPIEELARCYKLHKLSYHPGKEENLVKIQGEIAVLLTKVLIRRGFLPKQQETVWDQDANDKLAEFLGYENYDGRIRNDGSIDSEVLEDILKNHKMSLR
jgi:uncharacterized Ntn-hydrolase superfamily protein